MDSANESTNPWPHPDSEHFWRLAHKIEDKQLWAGYLTEQEHTIWRKALRERRTFTAFLEGQAEPVETGESQETEETVNGAPKADDNGEKVTDPVTTAFRARIMLFEGSVRKLFPSRTGEDFDFNVDDIVESTDDAVLPNEEKPKTRQVEEDNYDDEDEEEQESTALISVPQLSTQDADSSVDNIGSSHGNFNLTLDDSPPLPQIISFPYHTYYHTFEHDRVAMLELQTVEVFPLSARLTSRNSIAKTAPKQLRMEPKIPFQM